MKTRILINIHRFVYRHHVRNRTVVFVVGVMLLLLGMSSCLLAVGVIHDETFDTFPKNLIVGAGGQGTMRMTNGQAVLGYRSTEPADPNSIAASWTIWEVINWTIPLPKREAELRVDLNYANQDDAFVCVGLDAQVLSGTYSVILDRDEIALVKTGLNASQRFCVSYFFWDLVTMPNRDVTLTATFTPGDAVQMIRVRVLDKERQGTLLYEKTVYDTAGQDEVLPNRSAHGLLMEPEGVPRPFLGTNLKPFFGIVYANTDRAPTGRAEVAIDNFQVLEYDVPYLWSEHAVCLSWSEDTMEEQIVVRADSLTDPVWKPWPEPIFKRNRKICMDVPVAASERYFKLVPGTQYSDDFNPPQWPYASKGEWRTIFNDPGDASRLAITNIDGALKYQTVSAPLDGRVRIIPPGPDVLVGDYSVSLDIVAWDPNAVNQAVSIGARLQGSSSSSSGYYGILYLNSDNKNTGELHLFAVGKGSSVGPKFAITPGADYRIIFSGLDNKLSLYLYDLAHLEQPISQMEWRDSSWKYGSVILAIGTFSSSGAMAVDNFFVTGTKP